MMKDWEKLAERLDANKRNWPIEWATQDDLREYALGLSFNRLRERVASRFFHPILHAALEAGLITEV